MPDCTTRPLDTATWPDFAELVDAHNGVWGGCWCLAFHPEGAERGQGAAQRGAAKGGAGPGGSGVALVYDGAACVGWCPVVRKVVG
jgi:hypothetical protein